MSCKSWRGFSFCSWCFTNIRSEVSIFSLVTRALCISFKESVRWCSLIWSFKVVAIFSLWLLFHGELICVWIWNRNPVWSFCPCGVAVTCQAPVTEQCFPSHRPQCGLDHISGPYMCGELCFWDFSSFHWLVVCPHADFTLPWLRNSGTR